MPRFDIDSFIHLLYDLLNRGAHPGQGVIEVTSFCSKATPHRDWEKFRNLSIDEDLAQLERWLRNVFTRTPPEPDITGIWFGLFNPIRDDRASADLYVAGNPYDAADPEWPVSPRWWPKGRYSDSVVLDQIYTLAYEHGDSGLQNEAEYPLVLAYTVLAVSHTLRLVGPDLILSGVPRRVIALGFDSGDRFLLGTIENTGLIMTSQVSFVA